MCGCHGLFSASLEKCVLGANPGSNEKTDAYAAIGTRIDTLCTRVGSSHLAWGTPGGGWLERLAPINTHDFRSVGWDAGLQHYGSFSRTRGPFDLIFMCANRRRAPVSNAPLFSLWGARVGAKSKVEILRGGRAKIGAFWNFCFARPV